MDSCALPSVADELLRKVPLRPRRGKILARVDSPGGHLGPSLLSGGFGALVTARPALEPFRFPLGLHSAAADGAPRISLNRYSRDGEDVDLLDVDYDGVLG